MTRRDINEFKEGEQSCQIVIQTAEYTISAKIYLPVPNSMDNPTEENMLFYLLNSGLNFLKLNDCIVITKDNPEFMPEKYAYYYINLSIIQSCRIIAE